MTEGLRREIAALAATDLTVAPASLGDTITELISCRDALDAQIARHFAAFERAEGYADEHVTATGWLRAQTTMNHGQAAEQKRAARAREKLPLLTAAWDAGETTLRHVQLVPEALRRLPEELWAEVDEHIASIARVMTVSDFRAFLEKMVEQLEPLPKPKEETQHESRRLSVSLGFNGMTTITGRLTPEVADKLNAALSAASRPDVPDENRRANQRKADAMERILDIVLGERSLPVDGGEKPHVTVTVDLDSLTEQGQAANDRDPVAGRRDLPYDAEERAAVIAKAAAAAEAVARATSPLPRFSWTGPTSTRTARRLACDGVLTPILTRNGGPIDVGRRTRVITAPMRALIVARDKTCRWKGCGMHATWGVIHHVLHWADGGPTDAWNLVLLCQTHHTAAHSGRYIIRLVAPGRLEVRRRTSEAQPYYEIALGAGPTPGLDDAPAA